MSLLHLILGFGPNLASLEQWNDLARARDVSGLAALSGSPAVGPDAFRFLVTGGVYGGGRTGWTVQQVQEPGGGKIFAVFTTRMSCEDIGEQVFEVSGDRFMRKVDERETFGLKLLHHDMVVHMAPDTSEVTITDTTTFRQVSAGSGVFHVRLGPEWRVSAIQDEAGRAVSYAQAAGTVLISRPAKTEFKLKFSYNAVLKDPSLEGKMREDELMLAGACWWPSLARQATTTKIAMVSPADWRSFTHGTRVSESVKEGRRTTVWNNTVPISVLSASAGRYRVAQRKVGGITLWSASMVEPQAALELQNDINAGVVSFYDTLHPWPYPSWGSLISSRFVGGGLEAYSYATYARGWLPDVDPHEPAHTFFGGVIPNTYLKSLWNESFADFFEGFYYREGLPGNRADLRRAFVSIPDVIPAYRAQAAISAGAETGASASAIGYARGGLVLDMLEKEIGELAMRESIQTWLKEHPKGSVGEWEDFEKIVLRVAQRDVRWFFDQWLRKPGWADFEITDLKCVPVGDQWETSATLRFLGSPFRLRPEVLVRFEDGKTTESKLPISTGRSSEILRFRTKSKPKSVTFDPWLRIMRDIDRNHVPPSVGGVVRNFRAWVRPGDEAMAEQILGQRPRPSEETMPEDLNRRTVIGDPRKSEEVRKLLAKLPQPPVLQGSRCVFRGQSVDLSKGGFAAVIELGEGKRCVVAFGNVRLSPYWGQANAVLFDDLGRPLAATRAPVQSGPLHFEGF